MALGVGMAGDNQSPGAGGANPDTSPLAGSVYDDTVTHAFGTIYTAGSNRRLVFIVADCTVGAFIGWTKYTSGGNSYTPGGYVAGNENGTSTKVSCSMCIVVDPGTQYEAKQVGSPAIRIWQEFDF